MSNTIYSCIELKKKISAEFCERDDMWIGFVGRSEQ